MILDPCELTACLSALSCTIYKTFPREELPVLASALSQLGDTLETMLAQEERCTIDPKIKNSPHPINNSGHIKN